jgi:hypothetical protein
VRRLRVSASSTSRDTLVPAGPLILPVATLALRPAIDLPSTAVIRSPFSIPALAAGVPGKTLSTRSPRRSSSTVIPTPSNSPDTDWRSSLASLGVR